MEVGGELSLIRHMVDFGMAVLLWLVQLVIYPSFLKIQAAQLVGWHKTYTFRVSFLIVPMMFGQMGLALYAAQENASLLNVSILLLVFICWILTFFISVPLHRKIERGEGSEAVLSRLVWTNWPRTFLWSLVFILGCFA